MFTSDLVEDATLFAIEKHAGQARKYTHEPYVVHPIRVAAMLPPSTPTVYAGAVLHDVIEDCGVTKEELEKRFGPYVASLVVELTSPSKGMKENRAVRKEIDRQFLATVSPAAKLIKVADLLDNTPSIVKYDPGFAKKYLPEKWALLKVLHPQGMGDSAMALWTKAVGLTSASAAKLGIELEPPTAG